MAGVRATDQDRDKAVETIEEGFAKGQLNGAERELRTQKALQATTVYELQTLVSDLGEVPNVIQTLGTPNPFRSLLPLFRSRRLLPMVATAIAGFIAMFAFVIAAVAGRSVDLVPEGLPDFDNPFPQEQAQDKLDRNLLTDKGFTDFVKKMKAKFGTTLVDDATIYPEYAYFVIPIKNDPRHTERWSYRGSFEGTPSHGNRAADDPLIDLGKVDVKALMAAVGDSKTSLGVKDVNTTYIIFDERQDQPAMSVYVMNSYSDVGYLSLSLSGEELYVYRYE